MNAPVLIPPAPAPAADAAPRYRHDGWTPDRQRGFCEAIAEGETVADACSRVGMAPSTAYALRRRAGGAAFALGWDAARLLGRERLCGDLHARAVSGSIETITRPDGSTITRHRYDNRLATAMLRRADHYADARGGAGGQAARLVAAEFDAFLDVIGRDEGPARAGLFLGTRIGGEDSDSLAPVMALARADTWLRTGAARGAEVDIADLDPARRGEWSAEQWARAEAAGLLALAAPPESAPMSAPMSAVGAAASAANDATSSPLSPLCPDPARDPVWWDDDVGEWRTRFPPSGAVGGDEEGRYGEYDYSRRLDPYELELVEAAQEAAVAPDRVLGERARDEWFAEITADAMRDRAAAAALIDGDDVADDDDDWPGAWPAVARADAGRDGGAQADPGPSADPADASVERAPMPPPDAVDLPKRPPAPI